MADAQIRLMTWGQGGAGNSAEDKTPTTREKKYLGNLKRRNQEAESCARKVIRQIPMERSGNG